MIPSNSGLLQQNFEITRQPTKTFRMDMENYRIRGTTDGLEAATQKIYCVLNVERYQHAIHSRNFGVQLLDLFGEPVSFVIPEIKRRVTDALLWLDVVTRVDGWSFTVSGRIVACMFVVHTPYGEIPAERAVEF